VIVPRRIQAAVNTNSDKTCALLVSSWVIILVCAVRCCKVTIHGFPRAGRREDLSLEVDATYGVADGSALVSECDARDGRTGDINPNGGVSLSMEWRVCGLLQSSRFSR